MKMILGALLLVLPGAALAQAPESTPVPADASAIAVNADNFSADLTGRSGTYTGNVIVKQGAITLRADRVVVSAPGGKATQLEAQGNVVVDSPTGTAAGQTGFYDVATQTVRLTGDVVLTQDRNVMRGTQLEVNVATGQARLTAGGATAAAPGRVQGLFVPQGAAQR